MDSIHINTGEKRIAINGDPNRIIVFNPSDVMFAERFYKLIGEFETKLKEFQARADAIEKENADNESRLLFMREACEYIRDQIDVLFGKGTSLIAFGEALSLDAYAQFLEGITPFIQKSRVEKLQKYSPKTTKRSRK